MYKYFITIIISVLVLTGASCQLRPQPEVLPQPQPQPQPQVFLKDVYYYLPVNQQSTKFKPELVPANSLIVGCNDYLTLRKGESTVAVTKMELLKTALTQEFTVQPPADDFYANPLIANTKIKLDSIEDQNGKLIVKLSGEFTSPGECADPVMKGMIQETVKQYTNEDYQIILNGSEANWRCLFDLRGECK